MAEPSIEAVFSSVLIPLDLSAASDRVVDRAGLLPLRPKAKLTLLHVIPGRLPARALVAAEADAQAALRAAAKRLRQSVPRGVVVQQVVKVGSAPAQIAGQAGAVKAELIVMGRGGARALRDIFLGSTAERVLRRVRLPVLVVRLAVRGRYQRPLLALDLDPVATRVLAQTLRLLGEPSPRLSIVHAYDTPLHGLSYPSLPPDVLEQQRGYHRQKAVHELARLLASGLAVSPVMPKDQPWQHIHYGSPRSVIVKTVGDARADLLAVGTHGYSGLAQAFLGSVAGDVLRAVPCDVLVVPPSPRAR